MSARAVSILWALLWALGFGVGNYGLVICKGWARDFDLEMIQAGEGSSRVGPWRKAGPGRATTCTVTQGLARVSPAPGGNPGSRRNCYFFPSIFAEPWWQVLQVMLALCCWFTICIMPCMSCAIRR